MKEEVLHWVMLPPHSRGLLVVHHDVLLSLFANIRKFLHIRS